MANQIENKKKFIIALTEDEVRTQIVQTIEKTFTGAHFVYSHDGFDTLLKVDNDKPHIVFVDHALPKLTGIKVTETLLKNKKFQDMAIIILCPIPDNEHFVDEVVGGQVQFFNPDLGEQSLTKCLARALNFVSHGSRSEFNVKYLAPNDVLIKQGTKGEFVYIVKQGSLRAVLKKEGADVVLGKIGLGEFVGEMAYVNGEPRSADVIAETSCELIEIPIDHMDLLLFQKPAWSRALVKTLTRRIKIANLKQA
jgi:hypothetical protein